MSGYNIASALLAILGALMVVLGLFGGPEYIVMGMGLAALVAAGILGILQAKFTRR